MTTRKPKTFAEELNEMPDHALTPGTLSRSAAAVTARLRGFKSTLTRISEGNEEGGLAALAGGPDVRPGREAAATASPVVEGWRRTAIAAVPTSSSSEIVAPASPVAAGSPASLASVATVAEDEVTAANGNVAGKPTASPAKPPR